MTQLLARCPACPSTWMDDRVMAGPLQYPTLSAIHVAKLIQQWEVHSLSRIFSSCNKLRGNLLMGNEPSAPKHKYISVIAILSESFTSILADLNWRFHTIRSISSDVTVICLACCPRCCS